MVSLLFLDTLSTETKIGIFVGIVAIFIIGSFLRKFSKLGPVPKPIAASAGTMVFLDKSHQKVPLIEKTVISHDTALFRFGLPAADTKFGLPVGKHIKILAPNAVGRVPGEWNGQSDPETGKEQIQRSYTPTSSDNLLGCFDLVIKIYRAGEKERFPDGGKISQYIDTLRLGDELTISGPFGLIEYKGKGSFALTGKISTKKYVGMIAGGTGITPMYQIIHAVLEDPEDTTQLWLLLGNQTEADILLREELESLAEKHNDRFKLWYTLDRPGEGWKYSQGFINEEMLRAHMPAADENDSLVLMCGPKPMIDFACKPNLEKLGFTKPQMAVF